MKSRKEPSAPNEKQSLSKWSIFKSYYGYHPNPRSDIDYKNPLINEQDRRRKKDSKRVAIVYILCQLLPVSVPGLLLYALGYALGTPFALMGDLLKRKPLTMREINKAKERILAMSDGTFDAYLEKVMKFKKMDHSKYLRPKIEKIMHEANDEYEEKCREARAVMCTKKLMKTIDELKLDNCYKVELNHDHPLTSDELQILSNQAFRLRVEVDGQKRKNLKNALIEYIDNSFNAGKKIQRFAVQSVGEGVRRGSKHRPTRPSSIRGF